MHQHQHATISKMCDETTAAPFQLMQLVKNFSADSTQKAIWLTEVYFPHQDFIQQGHLN